MARKKHRKITHQRIYISSREAPLGGIEEVVKGKDGEGREKTRFKKKKKKKDYRIKAIHGKILCKIKSHPPHVFPFYFLEDAGILAVSTLPSSCSRPNEHCCCGL